MSLHHLVQEDMTSPVNYSLGWCQGGHLTHTNFKLNAPQDQRSHQLTQLHLVKPTQCAASRRTWCKQIRWMLSVINFATELSWQRFTLKVTNFQLPHPHLTYPTCTWRLRWQWPDESFAQIFSNRQLKFPGYCVALFAWSYVSVQHWLVADGHTITANTRTS